jgi:hypothetical protein
MALTGYSVAGGSYLALALHNTRLMVSLVGGVVCGWNICVAVLVLRSMEDLVLHPSQVGCVRPLYSAHTYWATQYSWRCDEALPSTVLPTDPATGHRRC